MKKTVGCFMPVLQACFACMRGIKHDSVDEPALRRRHAEHFARRRWLRWLKSGISGWVARPANGLGQQWPVVVICAKCQMLGGAEALLLIRLATAKSRRLKMKRHEQRKQKEAERTNN
ncbi:hypothetical protein niasHT_018301 [Heterodera trifolii]|uniref:Secreted protein n=1 Tax=Heterodera trifolii TaxID=157864 RepID=A0ABD2KYG4_9BILA